jgi:outer membrane protein OmpA-like peptidoglycan-associated protein
MLTAMKTPRLVACTATALAIAFSSQTPAQQLEQDVPVLSDEITGRLEGYSYKEGPESNLEFRGTSIALAGEGDAEVEFQDGRARVDVSVRKLPDPASLGPFSTYVLWAVSVDGRGNNLGSLEVENGRGSLDTSTALSQFALIVSAEPHFAVSAPSRAIVLQNLGTRVQGAKINISALKTRMDYSTLIAQPRAATADTPSDLVQARYALDIAEAAEAGRLAPRDFTEAEQLLARAEAAQADKKYSVRNTAPQLAREAVQKAEDARFRAVLAAVTERRDAAARAAREEAEQKAAGEAAIAAEEAKRSEALAAEAAGLEAEKRARADLTARLNRALPTRQTDRGIVAEIAGVLFATGAATLTPNAREGLARFAGIVGVYPSLSFKVEGHTDSTGSAETNRNLSLARATTVRDYLIGQSVDAGSINVEGLGPDRPVGDNATSEGRARNRRVEIILTGDLVAGSAR